MIDFGRKLDIGDTVISRPRPSICNFWRTRSPSLIRELVSRSTSTYIYMGAQISMLKFFYYAQDLALKSVHRILLLHCIQAQCLAYSLAVALVLNESTLTACCYVMCTQMYSIYGSITTRVYSFYEWTIGCIIGHAIRFIQFESFGAQFTF